MTFILPAELAEPEERAQLQAVEKSARASGTPFVSFFSPPEMLALAREAGFRQVQHVSAAELTQRYFPGRADGGSFGKVSPKAPASSGRHRCCAGW